MKSIQNCHLASSCAVRVGDARGARQHVQHDSDGPATRTDRAYPDRQTTPLGVSRSGYSGLLGSEGFRGRLGCCRACTRLTTAPGGAALAPRM